MSVSAVWTVSNCIGWNWRMASLSLSTPGTLSIIKVRWSRCTSAVKATRPVTISLTKWDLPWPTTDSLGDTEDREVSPLIWLGTLQTSQEKEGCGWEGGKESIWTGIFFHCLSNQLEHQGRDYPTCWASINFLPFINKVSLQTSFVVFWASPEDFVLLPSTWIPSTQ